MRAVGVTAARAPPQDADEASAQRVESRRREEVASIQRENYAKQRMLLAETERSRCGVCWSGCVVVCVCLCRLCVCVCCLLCVCLFVCLCVCVCVCVCVCG